MAVLAACRRCASAALPLSGALLLAAAGGRSAAAALPTADAQEAVLRLLLPIAPRPAVPALHRHWIDRPSFLLHDVTCLICGS